MTGDLEMELVSAVTSLDIQHSLHLLDRGVCLNFQAPHSGLPPLHSLLLLPCVEEEAGQQLALTQLLLMNGADPDLRDSAGRTALYVAVGREELVQLLLSWGATAENLGQVKEPEVTVKFH